MLIGGFVIFMIEDLGEDLEFGDDVEYEQCEMCGQEKIRYKAQIGSILTENLVGLIFFLLFSNLFVKNVVQDLTSAGIDWQREKWQSGLGSKFILFRYKSIP